MYVCKQDSFHKDVNFIFACVMCNLTFLTIFEQILFEDHLQKSWHFSIFFFGPFFPKCHCTAGVGIGREWEKVMPRTKCN